MEIRLGRGRNGKGRVGKEGSGCWVEKKGRDGRGKGKGRGKKGRRKENFGDGKKEGMVWGMQEGVGM